MSIKITSISLSNVKRVKAVELQPAENGLTVIGGKNSQGKSSVLDAIMWTLGGDRYKPSEPKRKGSMVNPHQVITLNNGIVAERAGKNSSLKVTDPTGKRAGQALLDSFVSQFALDLPKFMNATSKEKANILLQIIGVGDQLTQLERKETELYNRRTEIGRIRDQKQSAADEMTQWDGVPEELVSASDLIRQQQEILARNGENQRKRDNAAQIQMAYNRKSDEVKALETKLAEARAALDQLTGDLETASKSVEDLQDESTAELEENIQHIDELNSKIRDNLNKQKAQEEAQQYADQYGGLSSEIENLRKEKAELLNGAKMPLPNLTVENGELIYNGQKWDNMSGSEQLIVSTAIVKELKPECGFVLLDKLEQMDRDTLEAFGDWLECQKMQAIATRVSTGDECTIIIEDGYSVDPDGNKTAETLLKPAEAMRNPEPSAKWEAGKF